MRLVDTSAWVEWLTDTPLGRDLASELPAPEDWLVPTIVQLELAKTLARNVGEAEADRVIAFTDTCRVVELDTRIALSAAAVSSRHRLATADAIIYATALELDADLLTCDRHFEGLAGVRMFSKGG